MCFTQCKRLPSPKMKHGFKCLNPWDALSKCSKTDTTNIRLSCAPETHRTSGRQCRKHQGDKKNFSQVQWKQTFYRNSSGLANFCQTPGSFHEKPTDVLAAHLLPFGKTGLPKLLLGTAHGHNTWRTSSNRWPPAAMALRGHNDDHRVLQRGPEGKAGRPLRVRATGYSASIMNRISYASNSNISMCSTFQWNGNSHLNTSVWSLLV